MTIDKESRLKRFLKARLRYTNSQERADRSRFVWGSDDGKIYYLTPLGIINGLLPEDVRLVRIENTSQDVMQIESDIANLIQRFLFPLAEPPEDSN